MVVYDAAVYHCDDHLLGAYAALPELGRVYSRGAPLLAPALVVRRYGLRLHYVVRHRADDLRLGAQAFYKFLGRHAIGRAQVRDGQRLAFRGSGAGGGVRGRLTLFYRIEVLYDGAAREAGALRRGAPRGRRRGRVGAAHYDDGLAFDEARRLFRESRMRAGRERENHGGCKNFQFHAFASE